jgi:hypothetical protein
VAVGSDFSSEYEDLKDKDVNIEIKKYSKRRSLDANAYAWTIIDKIAEKTGIKKSEVYRNAIREIGGVSTIICVKDVAAESLCNGWSSHGTGWQTEKTKSKIPGCTNVTLWYGSSVFNTKQMSDLIDSLIQDAESLGIPTITEKEKDILIGKWTVKSEKGKEK